jgi:hypothetical protein
LLSLLGCGASASAQWSSGSLIGKVSNPDGVPIEGARVRIVRLARTPLPALSTSSDAEGRILLQGIDPGVYSLTVEAAGYLIAEHRTLVILAGQPTAVQVQMSAVQGETITVTAEPPGPETGVAAVPVLTIRRQELDATPNARDPWSVASRAPGVLPLGVNNGGSASGGQFYLVGPGAMAAENAYLVDGVPVTDMVFAGSSVTFFDFDQFEAIRVETGSADLSSPYAGVTLHLTTRSAEGAWRGSARALLADDALQATGSTAQRKVAARVDSAFEYGVEGGGTLFSGRTSAPSASSSAGRFDLGLWASASQQDVERRTARNIPVDLGLRGSAFKVSASSDRVRYHLTAQRNERRWWGRGLSPIRPLESTTDQRGPLDVGTFSVDASPSSIWSLSARAGLTDGEVATSARSSADTVLGSDGVWRGAAITSGRSSTSRHGHLEAGRTSPHGLLRATRFGVDLREQQDRFDNAWGPRNTVVYEPGVSGSDASFLEAAQFAAEKLDERYLSGWLAQSWSGRRGSWQLGVRYDEQTGRTLEASAPAHPVFPEYLPAFGVPGADFGFAWRSVSPRLSGVVALDGDGATLLRLGLGRAASQLPAWVGMWRSSVAERHAGILFDDLDGDHRIGPDDIVRSIKISAPTSPFGGVDPGLDPELYDSATVGLDREAAGFKFSADLVWRRNHRVLEERRLVRDGATVRQALAADYTRSITVGGALPGGEPYSAIVYGLDPSLTDAGVFLVNGDRQRIYRGLSLAAERPWDARWSLRGNLTVADWKWQVGPEFVRHDDPTDGTFGGSWQFGVDPADGDGEVAGDFLEVGDGSGVITNARWSYSLVSRLALFRDTRAAFDVSASVTGRDGYPLPYARRVVAPDGTQTRVQIADSDRFRTDPIHLLDLRLEKRFRIGALAATLGVDVFNVLGSDSALQRIRLVGPALGDATERVGPRIVRLGVRVNLGG